MSMTLKRRRASLRSLLLATAAIGISACYDTDKYAITAARVDHVLSLLPSQDSLFADGFSSLTISATVITPSDADKRVVSFTTFAGTLSGGSSVSGAQNVTANGNGIAKVTLTSAKGVQSVTVRAQVVGVPEVLQEKTIRFVQPKLDSIFRFVSVPGGAAADGTSQVAIAIAVSPRIPIGELRSLSLVTTQGSFVASGTNTTTLSADPVSNVVTVDLKSPTQQTTARISASIAGFTRDTIITFKEALPDTILVEVGAFSVPPTQEVPITVRLLRTRGRVAAGTTVIFEALDSSNIKRGQFRAVGVTNAEGTATATFQAVGITSPATLRIVARMFNTQITGSGMLEIKPEH